MMIKYRFCDDISQIIKYYHINSDGTVNRIKGKGCKTPRRLKSWIASGYERICLTMEGKPKEYMVHRLVAMFHIQNPENLYYVKHKDGNKLNNNFRNLVWLPYSKSKFIN